MLAPSASCIGTTRSRHELLQLVEDCSLNASTFVELLEHAEGLIGELCAEVGDGMKG